MQESINDKVWMVFKVNECLYWDFLNHGNEIVPQVIPLVNWLVLSFDIVHLLVICQFIKKSMDKICSKGAILLIALTISSF